jgi:hypothetical protein
MIKFKKLSDLSIYELGVKLKICRNVSAAYFLLTTLYWVGSHLFNMDAHVGIYVVNLLLAMYMGMGLTSQIEQEILDSRDYWNRMYMGMQARESEARHTRNDDLSNSISRCPECGVGLSPGGSTSGGIHTGRVMMFSGTPGSGRSMHTGHTGHTRNDPINLDAGLPNSCLDYFDANMDPDVDIPISGGYSWDSEELAEYEEESKESEESEEAIHGMRNAGTIDSLQVD